MVNKKYLLTLLFSTALLFALGLTSCQDDGAVGEPVQQDNFEGSEYAILDFDDAMSTVDGGTIDEEFSLKAPYPGDTGFTGEGHPEGTGGPQMHGPRNRDGKRHFHRIFFLLELDDAQKETVKTYLEENRTCMRSAFEQFREAARPILEAANEERKAIMEQYRNGEITNEEAYFRLKELRERTHEALENDSGVQAAKEVICDCKLTLLDNVGSILTESQLTIWNDWVSELEGPCFQ